MSRESEILEALKKLLTEHYRFTPEMLLSYWHPENYRGGDEPAVTSRLATIRQVLRTLAALNILHRDTDGEFAVVGSQQANLLLSAESEGGDGPPPDRPPQAEGGGGGGQNGDGFREVLSHPELFALPPSEFEALLRTIG